MKVANDCYEKVIGKGTANIKFFNEMGQESSAMLSDVLYTEAEYMAFSTALCDVLWLRQLAQELDPTCNEQTTILGDNESAIKLAKTDAFRPKTKHIDIRYHFIREKIALGVIDIEYVPTDDNAADSLTKGVTKQKHISCAVKMGLTNFE